MGWVSFMQLGGKRVLHLDLRGASVDEALRLMGDASEMARREAPRSVLMLVDVRGAAIDPRIGEAVHAAVTRDRPYLRAQAVVGVDAARRPVFKVAAAFLNSGVEAFETIEEASAWLVTR